LKSCDTNQNDVSFRMWYLQKELKERQKNFQRRYRTMTRTFNRTDALAKYRVSMKRKLRAIGCRFDNEASAATLASV